MLQLAYTEGSENTASYRKNLVLKSLAKMIVRGQAKV